MNIFCFAVATFTRPTLYYVHALFLELLFSSSHTNWNFWLSEMPQILQDGSPVDTITATTANHSLISDSDSEMVYLLICGVCPSNNGNEGINAIIKSHHTFCDSTKNKHIIGL